METGCLRLKKAEIHYGFLRESAREWLEFWYTITPDQPERIGDQIRTIEAAESELFETLKIDSETSAFRRLFSSDLVSHQAEIRDYVLRRNTDFFLSVTEQPPASGVKVALMGMCLSNITGKSRKEDLICLDTTSGVRHIYAEHLVDKSADANTSSEQQTAKIFDSLEIGLKELGTSIQDGVLRTWIYAPHLDADYSGIVKARRELFDSINLTKDTHYIASTGIQGGSGHQFARVFMDAYALTGGGRGAIRYIQAAEDLSPTHIYGVTFERATAVEIRNIDFLFISGTASIDKHGQIVHPGDVEQQTERTLHNITALLDSAGFVHGDLSSLIAYLRDGSDYTFVRPYLEQYAPHVPTIYVRAAVCRPGWLIEIEATAARIRSRA